jgi:hypothetical protein
MWVPCSISNVAADVDMAAVYYAAAGRWQRYCRVSIDVCSARRASSAGVGTVGVGFGLRLVGMALLQNRHVICDVELEMPSRPPSGIAGIGWPWATEPG